MSGVRRTLQPLKSLETVEADSVQAREARHEAQCPRVKTEDVCPEAEAEARPVDSCQSGHHHHHHHTPEHPLMDGLSVQHGPVCRVEITPIPEHGRHVAGGAAK